MGEDGGTVRDEMCRRKVTTTSLSMADVLELPDPLRQLVTWMMRRESSDLTGIAEHLGQDEDAARQAVTELADRGFVTEVEAGDGGEEYRARPAGRQKRRAPRDLWGALDDTAEK